MESQFKSIIPRKVPFQYEEAEVFLLQTDDHLELAKYLNSNFSEEFAKVSDSSLAPHE